MASKNIKGITIELGGDSTELQKALQKPEKNARTLTSELKEIDKALKFNPDSMVLLTQKSEVLERQIQATAEKLQIMRDAQAQVQAQAESGDLGAEQVRAFERELLKTEDTLRSLDKSLRDNNAEISKVSGGTKDAASSAEVFEKALKDEETATKKATAESKNHGQQVRSLKDDYREAESGALSFSDAVKASAIGNFIADGLTRAANALWEFAKAGAEAAKEFEVDQQRLTVAMRNTVNASQEQIDAVAQIIEQEEKLGVVSKEAQTAAAQELATYVTRRGSLEKLIPVLNNMIAQQNGVNASTSSTISVATALGKTLDGQVGSLQRWGYRFTEAEQKILKGNNEMRKLEVITDAVNASVGNMNYTLRDTTEAGRMFGAGLEIGAIQQEFGKNIESIKNNLMIQLLPSLTTITQSVNDFVVKNGNAIEAFGTIIATVANAIANLISIISLLPPGLLVVIGLVLIAVKAFTSINTGLGTWAAATKGMSSTLDPFTVKIIALIAALTLLLFLILAIKEGTDKAANSISAIGNIKTPSPNTRGFAKGTRNAPRGLAWVGEEGPEIVQFRGGERVFPARQSAQIAQAGSAGTTIGSQTSYTQVTVAGLAELQEYLDFRDNERRRGRALNGGG